MWLRVISAFISYRQRGERCSPSTLPMHSNSSAYHLNCTEDAVEYTYYKFKLAIELRNTIYNFQNPQAAKINASTLGYSMMIDSLIN